MLKNIFEYRFNSLCDAYSTMNGSPNLGNARTGTIDY